MSYGIHLSAVSVCISFLTFISQQEISLQLFFFFLIRNILLKYLKNLFGFDYTMQKTMNTQASS